MIHRLSRKRIIYLLISLLLFIFILFCRWFPQLAEWYMVSVYPVIAVMLSFISSKIPFSLFDVFITLYIVAFINSIILLIIRKIKFRKWLYVVVSTLVILFIWFYMSWGISYFRKDFYERTNVAELKFDSLTIKNFLSDYINELNESYIPEERIPYKMAEKFDENTEECYKNLQDQLHIPYPCGKRRLKSMLYQGWITKAGISGYFGPFFNEVHVNRYALLIEQPFTIAHEKAHQFGVSSEAECNLYAYIVCTASNNPHVRYSGYFGALGYVLSNTRKLLPDEYAGWYGKIKPEIMDDYRRTYEHWQKGIDPKVNAVQSKIYDAYLKTNKIKSGVSNYSEMVTLLVSWHNHKAKQ